MMQLDQLELLGKVYYYLFLVKVMNIVVKSFTDL